MKPNECLHATISVMHLTFLGACMCVCKYMYACMHELRFSKLKLEVDDRTRNILKGVPVLDRIGNVVKHILLMEDRGPDKGSGDSEGSSLHKEDVDGDLLKAFMTTDAAAMDVPIVETSPGFQVALFCVF